MNQSDHQSGGSVDNHSDLPQTYTVTLDDDPIVPKVIEQITQIPSLSFRDSAPLIEKAHTLTPLAVFIDIHLGTQTNGLEAVPQLREVWRYCPILIVTSDPNEDSLQRALQLGADDFIMKPIRPLELSARLQARLFDQAQKKMSTSLSFGNLTFDTRKSTIRSGVTEKMLSPTERSLLHCLMEAQGTLVHRSVLKLRTWGKEDSSDGALDRKIYELRRALEEVGAGITISTEYGKGFVLKHVDGSAST